MLIMIQPRKVMRRGLLALTLLLPLPAAGQLGSITIDDQPTAEQKLAEINDLRQAGRYDDAVELVQELVDGARFKLVGSGDRQYIDAERWVRRELSRDGELARAYRERYTAEAEREVGKAMASRESVALREAYRRFGLTAPGLEAGAMLAGLSLEAGDPTSAYAITQELLEHPDWDTQRARILQLHGSAAALMGDGELVDDVAQRLDLMGREDAAEALRQLAAGVTRPVSGWSRPVVDAGPEPESLTVPLWSEVMARRGVELDAVRRQIDGIRVVPVASRDLIYINTGRQLLAMDRAAGPVLWAFPEDVLSLQEPLRSRRPIWPDTRAVAVEGGRAFGVLGECYGLNGNGREDVPANRLVCVDASSGAERWSRVAGEVDEGEPLLFDDRRGDRVNLLQTHFVGTPLIAEGQVLIMLRRANQQGLVTTWLLSFDSDNGQLRWLRHVALAQVRHTADSALVSPQMTLAGNTVYLTDSVGVAAAIDARSGAYKWLTVLAEDRGGIRSGQINLETDGVLTPPVMTRAGLVVCLASTQQRLTLLDPEDGTVLSDMDFDRRLVGAQYILDVAGDVLVVARSSVSLWDGEQAEVRWSVPLDQQPRGRGDVSRLFAIVPTTTSSIVFDLKDGSVMREVPDLIGNVVVLQEEVLVSAGGQLHSYMSWQRAYERLVRRIEQRPNDPDAGLALASLALGQGEHRDAVMQGVEYAMQAVDRLDGAQAEAAGQRVFGRLRGLAAETREADPALRLRLYDQLALASRTAEQEVAYHLDFGRYLVQVGRPRLAVEHFQAVMVDPAFSSQGYLIDSGQQPAGNIAQRELMKLVEAHGRSIYARFDALAWQRLDRLSDRPDADPADYALIAQRYPLAEAASPALLAAAAILRERAEPFGELSYCQQAVARAVTPDQLNRAVGAMLEVQLRHANGVEARHVIEWVSRQFPGIRPVRDGAETNLADWLSDLNTLPKARQPRPDIPDALDTAVTLQGRALGPAPGQTVSLNPGYLYLHDGQTLRQIDLQDGLNERWSIPLEGRQLYLIADDRGQLLIWDVRGEQVVALDARTGARIWRRPADLSGLSPSAWDVGNGRVQGVEVVFDSNLPKVIVSPTMICLADQSGMVIGIDRYLGKPLWRVRTGLSSIRAVAVDGWALAVAGLIGPERQLNHGRVVVLDLLTGESRLDQIDLHVEFAPDFVAIDRGRLIVVGGRRVSGYSMEHGGALWEIDLGVRGTTGKCALGNDLLAVEDPEGLIQLFDLTDGIRPVGRQPVGHTQSMTSRVLNSDTHFVVHEDGVWFCSPRAIGRVGHERGGLLWRDAISQPESKRFGLAVGAARVAVVLSAQDGPDPDIFKPADQPTQYTLCVFDAVGGRQLQSYQIGPMQGQPDPRGLRVVEGGLVMPMGPQTLFLTSSVTAPILDAAQ